MLIRFSVKNFLSFASREDNMSEEFSMIGTVSYETLLNWFMDYLYEEKILVNSKAKAKSLWQTLEWICSEKLQITLTEPVTDLEETCRMLAEYFQDKEGYEQIVDDVPRIIRNRAITYEIPCSRSSHE